jgi:hypothetical protein
MAPLKFTLPTVSQFLVSALLLSRALAAEGTTTVWSLADVRKIGGVATEVLGVPKAADGAAVFDGAHDGVFVPALPLAGAKEFTIEILFSPAEGGPPEQRFFHLQDMAESRVMIETRLDGKGGWWLDTFLGTPKGGTPLIDPKLVHPTNKFYWAAVRYDGNTMTAFVNGQKELEASGVKFGPFVVDGKVSLGVRQNKVYWFKGAIREVRFTPAALAPEKLQKVK